MSKQTEIDDLEGEPLRKGDVILDIASGFEVMVIDNDHAIPVNGSSYISWRKNGCWTRKTMEEVEAADKADINNVQNWIRAYAPLCSEFVMADVVRWVYGEDSPHSAPPMAVHQAISGLVVDGTIEKAFDTDTWRIPTIEVHEPLNHPSNEYALDTIDALLFSGGPCREDMPRIQYMLRRWEKQLQACQKFEVELELGFNNDEENDA